MHTHQSNIIIVGAGLTGLHLAQSLQQRGKNCLILEKSKGLGGRIATRRIDDLGLDHGAAYIIDSFEMRSALQEFKFHPHSTTYGLSISGGMNQIAKALAQNLHILKSQKLQSIKKQNDSWELKTEEGMQLNCQHLIITAPIPQALELLEKNHLAPEFNHPIYSIKYSFALILLAIVEDVKNHQAHEVFEDHQFILMEERKLHPQGLVLQLSPSFSQKFFEETEEVILSQIFNMLKDSPYSDVKIQKYELKKWRYSRPLAQLPVPYFEVAPQIYLAGDGFTSPIKSAEAVASLL
jgi:predicted NAD/FAD-dependent oxidoreductase